MAAAIPACLYNAGAISAHDKDSASGVFAVAAQVRDSLRQDTTIASFYSAAEVTRALAHVSEFYSRGLLADSARFHRLVDHVLVTLEYVRGSLRWVNGRAWPATTPWLSWAYYPSVGIHFQVVNTIQVIAYPTPNPTAPLDSVLGIAEHIWRYGLWREFNGRRFKVWEYEFTWGSGGIWNDPPWISSLGEGFSLMLFAECFRRTGDPIWRERASQVLSAFSVDWDDGGVLLADTSHGYWWEEFNPTARIFNGAAWSVVGVGYFWQITRDPEAKRLFDRGVAAIKYYAPDYDTGSWTLYSATQGYATVSYHRLHIQLMDILYSQTGDIWFKETADRWRTYQPPPGVT